MLCAEEVENSTLHWGKCKVWSKPGSVIIIRLLEIECEIYYGLCSLSCYLHHTRMFTLLGSGLEFFSLALFHVYYMRRF